MKNIAPSARDLLCLKLDELRQIALETGVTGQVTPDKAGKATFDILIGAAVLQVHYVDKNWEGDAHLAQLIADLPDCLWLEHYIVYEGYSNAERGEYQAKLNKLKPLRATFGTLAQYKDWVKGIARNRLGPLANLSPDSLVRKLGERLIGQYYAAEPNEKQPLTESKVTFESKESYELGDKGVQLVMTLLRHALKDCHGGVDDFQFSPSAQKDGFDISIRLENGKSIKADIKTEKPATGNLSLEKYSSIGTKVKGPDNRYIKVSPRKYKLVLHATPKDGWLRTSKMELLITLIWGSGDLFIIDFEKVKQWVLKNEDSVPLVDATVDTQNYVSQVYLANLERVLAEIPEAIHLDLRRWLPKLYGNAFEFKSQIPLKHKKTLEPQRSNYLRAAALKKLDE